MKKLFFAICAAAAVFSFSACRKADSASVTIEKQWMTKIDSDYVVMDLSNSGSVVVAASVDGVNFYVGETYTLESIKYNDDKTSGRITLTIGTGEDAETGYTDFKDLKESSVSIQVKGEYFPFTVSNYTLKSTPEDK